MRNCYTHALFTNTSFFLADFQFLLSGNWSNPTLECICRALIIICSRSMKHGPPLQPYSSSIGPWSEQVSLSSVGGWPSF
ncbi:hypothetical protein I7I50_03081 [Histoplasma capsulatum G186AR]|uniref:Uncharacterized protein n=1 Tax=Ajellomyces capsulatus TaxID=5037 RepID=A0A8H8D5H4_AJECA|nr:hypothetical protein I7I52_00253 [Histoplasma capsulatum]QSS72030.1 hypothetical protein I7I50_03081 [Histoplasma capsulatum G186AR]